MTRKLNPPPVRPLRNASRPDPENVGAIDWIVLAAVLMLAAAAAYVLIGAPS